MPYLSIAQAALAEWRKAVRLMDAEDPESPAWQEAFLVAELAKAAYEQTILDATRAHRRVPIPFSEAADLPTDPPSTEAG